MTTTSNGPGLILNIFRHANRDCTAGGLSSKVDSVTLVGFIDLDGDTHPMPEGSRVFPATDERPAVLLRVRQIGTLTASIEPLASQGQWHMMGGNFAYTSDSRFSHLLEELGFTNTYSAIPIHDRIERTR